MLERDAAPLGTLLTVIQFSTSFDPESLRLTLKLSHVQSACTVLGSCQPLLHPTATGQGAVAESHLHCHALMFARCLGVEFQAWQCWSRQSTLCSSGKYPDGLSQCHRYMPLMPMFQAALTDPYCQQFFKQFAADHNDCVPLRMEAAHLLCWAHNAINPYAQALVFDCTGRYNSIRPPQLGQGPSHVYANKSLIDLLL